MSLQLKIIRIDKTMPMPKFAQPGDAAFDLLTRETVTLKPGERFAIPSGLKMEIPFGYVGFIWDKGGISYKQGIKTFGGVVDAGYRGEVMITVMNFGTEPYTFEKHHKVAQMCIQKHEEVEFEEVDELSNSARGEGRHGSTGK